MSKVEVIPRNSIEAEPAYPGCTSDAGSSVTACPTSSQTEECMILAVFFEDPDGRTLERITIEDEVDLVVKTQNLEGEVLIIDLNGTGGHFAYNDQSFGKENVLKLTVGSSEERIRLQVIPAWIEPDLSILDRTPPKQSTTTINTAQRLLVTAAVGPHADFLEADVAYEFSVKSFNRAWLPEELAGLQWAWKIPGGYMQACVGSEYILPSGYPAIKLSWNANFIGSEVIVMPYMNSPTENVSARVTISGQSIERGLIVTTNAGKELFRLDDGQDTLTRITAHQLYARGTQWFEPLADNYMRMTSKAGGIETFPELRHFTWQQISDFSDVDRWATSFRQGGSGDWKAADEGARRFLMVTVNGDPYWADAVGQIPFAVDQYRDEVEEDADQEGSIRKTLEAGMAYGSGELIGGTADHSNSYDNYFILRGALYAAKRYVPNTAGYSGFGEYDLVTTPSDPNSLGQPISAADATNYGLLQ